jgi:hypothetical protein
MMRRKPRIIDDHVIILSTANGEQVSKRNDDFLVVIEDNGEFRHGGRNERGSRAIDGG